MLSIPHGKADAYTASRTRLQNRANLCSMLAISGCNLPDMASSRTMELLDAIGCFSTQQAVLIGSHAFNVIGNMLGVTWDAGDGEPALLQGMGVHGGQPSAYSLI